MAAPNLVNVTSIYGKTMGASLGTSNTNMLICASNKVYKVNSIIVSNVDGTNAADASIEFYDASATAATRIASTVAVPADSTLIVVDKNASLYLEEGTKLVGGASANSDLEAVISYEEIS